MIKKRQDYISRDTYFMGIAMLSAQRSKDPSTQVWACIVNQDKKIVGVWYNWFPTGCSDEELPRDREGPALDTKYLYVCHAELNAILNKSSANLKWCSIYVALSPCNECAKAIIQSWIKEVIYLSDKYKDLDIFIAAKRMFDLAWVKYRKIEPDTKEITINFKV